MSILYATIECQGSHSFSEISSELEKNGYHLTPAKTRLIILNSLETIVRKIGIKHGKPINRKNAQLIAKDVDFQNTIAPFIQGLYLNKRD